MKTRVTEKMKQNVNMFIYNITMSNLTEENTFKFEEVYREVKKHNLDIDRNDLKAIFSKWMDVGLIYDNVFHYIVM